MGKQLSRSSAQSPSRVFVYFNLHKKCWSVRDCKTRRVIQYARWVELEDVQLKVSQAGRQRVLRERRKNIHAGLEGKLIRLDSSGCFPALPLKRVTYNPYKYDSFVFTDTLSKASFAKKAWMLADGLPNVSVLV